MVSRVRPPVVVRTTCTRLPEAPQEVQLIGPDALEQQWCPESGFQWWCAPKETCLTYAPNLRCIKHVLRRRSSSDWFGRAMVSRVQPEHKRHTPMVAKYPNTSTCQFLLVPDIVACMS